MKRITIICRADANPVAAVTELLGVNNINIEGFDFNQHGKDAYLSLDVGEYDRSLSLLITAGYNAVPDDVVLIRGRNRPGELAEIARHLVEEGVQVRSLSLMEVHSEDGLVALATDNNARVREIFTEQLVN